MIGKTEWPSCLFHRYSGGKKWKKGRVFIQDGPSVRNPLQVFHHVGRHAPLHQNARIDPKTGQYLLAVLPTVSGKEGPLFEMIGTGVNRDFHLMRCRKKVHDFLLDLGLAFDGDRKFLGFFVIVKRAIMAVIIQRDTFLLPYC